MRYLISTEIDRDPYPPAEGRRTVRLAPDGEVPPLARLVRLAASREGAVAYVEREVGRSITAWYRIGVFRGWDTWVDPQPDGSWTRWRLQPVEMILDVGNPPGDPVAQLAEAENEARVGGPDVDPLLALAAGDRDALHRAALTHGMHTARANGNAELADAIACELHALDLEVRR